VISPDGTKVIFVSDMVGGFGKSDLYEAPIISNDDNGLKIGEAVNMGPKVNTVLRDNFPRFSDSGDLYFSSEGHLGFGGLDVFTLDKNSGMVINLGKPVNSNLDDFAALFHDKWGTLSSNRTNNGSAAPKYNDNLYFFRWTEDKDSTEPTVNEVLVSVYDKDSKLPIPQASIALDNLDDQDKAIQAGMNEHLGKPFKKADLVQMLSHWLVNKTINSSHEVVSTSEKYSDIYFDRTEALDNLDGDEALYDELLLDFKKDLITDYYPCVDQLKALNLESNDTQWKQLKATIHTLKGVSGVICATLIYKHTVEINALLHDHIVPSELQIEAWAQAMQETVQRIA
jgi:hypothetical protein